MSKKESVTFTVNIKKSRVLHSKLKTLNKLITEIEKLIEDGTTLQPPKSSL